MLGYGALALRQMLYTSIGVGTVLLQGLLIRPSDEGIRKRRIGERLERKKAPLA